MKTQNQKKHTSPKITITAEMIRQYTYCPRKIYWRHVMGFSEPKTPQVERGKRIHKKIWHGRKTIKRKNKTQKIERCYYVYDPKTQIAGTIDLLIITKNNTKTEYTPIEIKTGFTKTPQKQHIIQLATYIMLLKNTGHNTQKGILYYKDKNKKYEITLTKQLEKEILQAKEKITEIILNEKEPPKTKTKKKCPPCEYNKLCNPTNT